MRDEELFEVEGVVCTAATANAVKADVGGDEVWIPRSLLRGDNDIKLEGDHGKLVIPLWKAKEIGLDG